jgi:hypothetical protein
MQNSCVPLKGVVRTAPDGVNPERRGVFVRFPGVEVGLFVVVVVFVVVFVVVLIFALLTRERVVEV